MCASNGHFTIPFGHGREVMIGKPNYAIWSHDNANMAIVTVK